MRTPSRLPGSWSLQTLLGATALGLLATSTSAFAADPIRIGVIAEAQAIAGASIPQAAQMAADEINQKGGVDGRKIEIVTYDNHSSSADSVRAFQRAVRRAHQVAVLYLGGQTAPDRTGLVHVRRAVEKHHAGIHRETPIPPFGWSLPGGRRRASARQGGPLAPRSGW